MNFSAYKSYKPELIGHNRTYGILIPLVRVQNEWHILFEVRSLTMRAQPGEICFPGGLVESDENPRDAACREACEELGLMSEQIEILGPSDYLLTPYKAILYPFVGIISIDNLNELDPNPLEVDSIFTIPLTELIDLHPEIHPLKTQYILEDSFPLHKIPNGANYQWKSGDHSVYFYEYDKYIIWGLTAQLLHAFINQCKKINQATSI